MESVYDTGSDKIVLGSIVEIAEAAGLRILEIYDKDVAEWDQKVKSDSSPLTQADLQANAIICEKLIALFPNIPIMSEENKQAPYEERIQWEHYWCVDPLDGTKEFIKRNGEFTVNIALCKTTDKVATPVLGVVHTPVSKKTHMAALGSGAFLRLGDAAPNKIEVSTYKGSDSGLTLVCSRSHLDDKTKAFMAKYNDPKTASMGSSLKFMLIAEGEAQIYPRLAPTMEWDTAAAQVVVEQAGGKVVQFESREPVIYNKPDLLNPFFLCYGNQTD
uniref:3'(2'),5'-bisphosphate nucleotidase 1 n=2 Tax=Rhodosorus marinus TaxID=101924 RepID=A0A7S2ZA61_9RHOD|mmetsp:Transcript_11549/g.48046  ORF Transcript_11549/g.48046 Transcript_11549/m.48046 type:complete len:274 (+) Transcript_11549:119-940(+)|eukprot:CAMPEP_0113964908 /NCGR_PEP_ID=MMETSP0011_2-20120614/7438_1 /TAXON_ID=101924 /ORGANISM="Rhodosorus marinus" /LENGTH=273 /DNA_ID=CAMNT_0000977337 /DNA_START=39 /DNA_END=860 /DNA_ORIENTATION=+ /assembly_acc=CAM_ASM_000156